jgi:hypothetical protein
MRSTYPINLIRLDPSFHVFYTPNPSHSCCSTFSTLSAHPHPSQTSVRFRLHAFCISYPSRPPLHMRSTYPTHIILHVPLSMRSTYHTYHIFLGSVILTILRCRSFRALCCRQDPKSMPHVTRTQSLANCD